MKTEYVFLDAQGKTTSAQNAEIVLAQTYNDTGELIGIKSVEIGKGKQTEAANNSQGSYGDNLSVNDITVSEKNRNKADVWICPNDETKNTGNSCIICGALRPTSSRKKKLRIALVATMLALLAVVFFISQVGHGLPGYYISESGRYSISLEKDGTCFWYQDNMRFSGSYTEEDTALQIEIKGNKRYKDTAFTATIENGNLRINGGTVESELFVRGTKDVTIQNLDQTTVKKGVIKIAAASYHVAVLRSDGTVIATGDRFFGTCDVNAWTDIVDIDVSTDVTVGLRKDKTICVSPNDVYNNTQQWRNIKSVAAGFGFVAALTEDGRVLIDGTTLWNIYAQELASWRDVTAIYSSDDALYGIKKDRTVVAVGANDVGQCDVADWTDVVELAVNDRHVLGLRSDGTVIATGENMQGGCNTAVWENVVKIDAGLFYSAGMTKTGEILLAGPTYITEAMIEKPIADLSAGEWNIVFLHEDGTLSTCGGGSYENVHKWRNIKMVTAGESYIVAVTKDNQILLDTSSDVQKENFADWLTQ